MWVCHRPVGICGAAPQNIATQSRQWRRARFQRLVARCQAVGLNTSKVQLQKSPPQVRSTSSQRKGREKTGKMKMNQWLTKYGKISNQISSYCIIIYYKFRYELTIINCTSCKNVYTEKKYIHIHTRYYRDTKSKSMMIYNCSAPGIT